MVFDLIVFKSSALFNSIQFLIFFPIVVALYFLFRNKYRWMLLLLASYYFYMSWKPEYAILLFVSTIVDYFCAIGIHRSTNTKMRKLLFATSLTVNLGFLFTFKYLNFVSESTRQFLSLLSINFSPPVVNLLLPLGISFYTFQTLSYTIDVYRREIKPEKHFGIFAVYVSFFPQLVAGPIERAKHLMPQLKEEHKFDRQRVADGLKLMMWGFFKKVVIADRVAVVVDTVYADPSGFGGLSLILASIFFAYQVYCDFSGYSDIAIGAAQVLGVSLVDNFRRPYYSRSIGEFWRRWHMSLSSWFNDHVFIPLYLKISKMKKVQTLPQKTKHAIAFTISIIIGETLLGIWHGANWTFAAFGLYFGIMIALYYLIRTKWDAMNKYVQIFLTFVIVNIGWVFFRSETISKAFYILTHFFVNWNSGFLSGIGLETPELIIAIVSIIFLECVQLIQEHKGMRHFLSEKPTWLRWLIYIIVIIAILLFGVFERRSFIYFQF